MIVAAIVLPVVTTAMIADHAAVGTVIVDRPLIAVPTVDRTEDQTATTATVPQRAIATEAATVIVDQLLPTGAVIATVDLLLTATVDRTVTPPTVAHRVTVTAALPPTGVLIATVATTVARTVDVIAAIANHTTIGPAEDFRKTPRNREAFFFSKHRNSTNINRKYPMYTRCQACGRREPVES